MKFHVSDACIGCGLCCATCPEVFTMSDAGTAQAVPGDVSSELEASALEARDGCPVEAIEQN